MDKKRYKKTRYQNIYKGIKKENYIVVIPGTKYTISTDENNNKIFDIKQAIKIRDDKKIRITKKAEKTNNMTFKELWSKYIHWCKDNNLAYNTWHKKEIIYNAYLKHYDNIKIIKLEKNEVKKYLDNLNTTSKNKNKILSFLKAFMNWCVRNNYIPYNQLSNIQSYKEEKAEMKYWLPEHLKKYMDTVNDDIKNSTDPETVRIAYVVKMLVLIGFSLGDRVGETRALRFCDVNKEYKTISISHSIDYNPKSKTHLKATKNEQSKRIIDVSDKLISEIEDYKKFLTDKLKLDIADDTFILINPINSKPYSDVALRKHFNHYIEKAGVPKIRMYDLRHTFVTTMMTEGWEMYAISKRIGHSNIQTTINTYGHISEKVRKEMAITTDKYY